MKQHDQEPQLITTDALATQLSVSVRTIRAWQAEGRIPYVRLSRGTVRFSLPSVMKALEERTVAARPVRDK
ncbi:MAG: excisionase family DNA-binding protein [Verrucomicrobiota bacterium]